MTTPSLQYLSVLLLLVVLYVECLSRASQATRDPIRLLSIQPNPCHSISFPAPNIIMEAQQQVWDATRDRNDHYVTDAQCLSAFPLLYKERQTLEILFAIFNRYGSERDWKESHELVRKAFTVAKKCNWLSRIWIFWLAGSHHTVVTTTVSQRQKSFGRILLRLEDITASNLAYQNCWKQQAGSHTTTSCKAA